MDENPFGDLDFIKAPDRKIFILKGSFGPLKSAYGESALQQVLLINHLANEKPIKTEDLDIYAES